MGIADLFRRKPVVRYVAATKQESSAARRKREETTAALYRITGIKPPRSARTNTGRAGA